MPAFRNSRENPGFDDAVRAETGADSGDELVVLSLEALFTEPTGMLRATIFPEELSEPLSAAASASKPT